MVERTARFRGVYRVEYVQSLVATGRFDQAVRLLEASGNEGLGIEAEYWRARALWGVGRIEEAQAAYEEVKALLGQGHQLGLDAAKDLEAIKRGEKLKAS
ncbi:Tetratricopeptide repeat protein [compost metagenome]